MLVVRQAEFHQVNIRKLELTDTPQSVARRMGHL
jgi:hypothetical protein